MNPTVLTVAGFDPSGGAGIGADLKTMAAFRCHGVGAVTAITVQNTRGVDSVHPLPPDLLDSQIRSLASDVEIRAVKIGMLGEAGVVQAVAKVAEDLALVNLVLDPVLCSSSGTDLLDDKGVEALREHLLPRAQMVTPNLDEARRLTGRSVDDVASMKEAARELHRLGARQVVITGGHLPGRAVDVLYDGSEFSLFDGSRVPVRAPHGLGCAFSSALSCGLARGFSSARAVEDAKRYVAAALGGSYRPGRGASVLDHRVRRDRRS